MSEPVDFTPADFRFVGPACNARFGRTSIRCGLPALHGDPGADHAHLVIDGPAAWEPLNPTKWTVQTWHARKPEPVGRTVEVAEPPAPVTKQDIARALGSALIIPGED